MDNARRHPILRPGADERGGLVGRLFLGPSGFVWTVRSLTAGRRVFLVRTTPEGDAGAVVDLEALDRMVPVPDSEHVAEQTGGPSYHVTVDRSDRVVA